MLPASPAHSRFTDSGRGLIAMSLLAGLAYPFADTALPLVASVFIKGLSVGLLALAAALLASSQRWWLAAILGAGAIGDVLLDVPGLFLFGAGALAIGHIVTMLFYVRVGRRQYGIGEHLAAAALVGWGLVMPSLVSPPGTPIGGSMLYSVLLCGMAAALLLSRFFADRARRCLAVRRVRHAADHAAGRAVGRRRSAALRDGVVQLLWR